MSPLLLLSLCFFTAALAIPSDPYATRATCGDTQRTCVTGEGKCVRGKCRCWRPYGVLFGAGNFRCFKPTHVGCEIKNDPKLTTFNREEVNFPYPCRFLATHVRTKLKEKSGNVIGDCEAKIYGYNAKELGKLYVLGFDVALRMRYNDPAKSEEFSYRNYGSARSNTNGGLSLAKNGQWQPFSTDGRDDPNYSDEDNGVYIHAYYDNVNNRFVYWAQGCGVAVTFVPYDVELKLNQTQIPGLAVSVNKESEPTYLSQDRTVCMVPKDAGGERVNEVDRQGLSEQQWVALRTFKSSVPQLHPLGDFGKCQQIQDTINGCHADRQREAIKSCHWMFTETQFAKCYDTDGSAPRLLALFNSCAKAWCTGNPCDEAMQLIKNSGCADLGKVPRLSLFMTGALCPKTS